MRDWLRYEWARTGLPFSKTNGKRSPPLALREMGWGEGTCNTLI